MELEGYSRPTYNKLVHSATRRFTVVGVVRYAEFTPRPVNQTGAQGEEAGRRLANGGAQQRRRRGKMHKRRAYRVSGGLL